MIGGEFKNESLRDHRWIVAQEGSRRNYAVPAAFCALGRLRLLFTDIWLRAGRADAYLRKGPRLARALTGRHHPAIPNHRVISFSLGAIAHKAAYIPRLRSGSLEDLGHFWCDYGAWFASHTRDHIKKLELDPAKDLFFGFDTGCLEALPWLRQHKVTSIINQVDPARFEEDLVAAEAERWPEWSAFQGRLPASYWDRLKAEWDLADLVAVNSDWTRDALIKQGVPDAKIFVTPLGLDLKGRFKILARPMSSSPLKVLWLGSVNLRKGIPYFIEAARLLQGTSVEFLIAGGLEIKPEILSTFPPNVKVLGPVPRIEVPRMFARADVFVLPTISDGFGITQLEAMSQGLPVIATPNCGRVVTHGVDGFIIPARDSQALADALAQLANNRRLWQEMSRQAQISVRRFDLPSNIEPILKAVGKHFKNGSLASMESGAPIELSPGRSGRDAANGPASPVLNHHGELAPLPAAVLCHAGHRDLYHVAWALREADLLENLVTDFFYDPQRAPFLSRILPKLKDYSCKGLSLSDVHLHWRTMIRAAFLKQWPSRSRQIEHDRDLGRTARRLAEKTGTTLFSYSYYAAAAFQPGPGLPANRILFQMHPHPASVRKLLQEELERVPEATVSLQWEHEVGSSEEHFESLCREPLLANAWMAASSFTARTLAENGVPRDRIHVVPYGVDPTDFPARQTPLPKNQPLRLVWIGNLVQRKGLTYLLDAVGRFSARDVELVICTHNPVDGGVVRRRNLPNVKLLVGIPNPALVKQLHAADLFVLPALLEGFAAVILEAMSCGVPVLTTPNTCGPDLLEQGVTGFIVPIRSTDAIAERIEWALSNRERLFEMGQAAARSARAMSWQRFRTGIVAAYRAILEGQNLREAARLSGGDFAGNKTA